VKQITAYRCCFSHFKACNAKVSYFSAFVASQSPKFFHALLPHVLLSTADPLKFLPHFILGTVTFIIYFLKPAVLSFQANSVVTLKRTSRKKSLISEANASRLSTIRRRSCSQVGDRDTTPTFTHFKKVFLISLHVIIFWRVSECTTHCRNLCFHVVQ